MELIKVPIKDLKPNTDNPRRISKGEMNKLMRSLKEFGFLDPVIVNSHPDRKGIIIGGHQRVQAAKRMGIKEVPVIYTKLAHEKESLLNMALNEISGEWDEDKLRALLTELSDQDVDLTLSGFDEPFIDEILSSEADLDREANIDQAPLPPINPKAKLGDCWTLGRHRLVCGDSTKKETFEQLMGDEKADLSWTDPPYGVSYRGTNNPNDRDWGVMQNDDLTGEKLQTFLTAVYKNLYQYTKDNVPIYSCYASRNHFQFETALKEAGYVVNQTLVWEKGHVLGHSDYHWCHEPILYCNKEGQTKPWYGDRTHKTVILQATIEQLQEKKKEELIDMISKIRQASDIVHLQKDPSSEYVHSTQKPVELSRQMIKNSSRPKSIILEPFCGSGATLLACETSNRSCRAIEIEPKYVDVIIIRWQKYTDQAAVRQDGKKWSEI